MTTIDAAAEDVTTAVAPAETSDRRPLRGGWRIVAAKELGDHLRSIRFNVLLLLVGLAGLAAVYTTSGNINDLVGSGPKSTSLFLYLFTGVPSSVSNATRTDIPSFVSFIGILGPLLGLAFGFDAVSGERAQRTLPRLVSQPIHRDDVITGKFAAGMAAIAVVIGTLTIAVSGVGMLRLGLVPSLADGARVLTFVVISLLYIGVWLGVSIVASIRFRETSTAALTTMAVWMVLTLFLGLITGAVADRFHRIDADPTKEPDVYSAQVVANERFDSNLQKLSPAKLYDDASAMVLNPYARSTSTIIDPSAVDQAIPSPLPLSESLVVALTQVAVLTALTLGLFIAAYLLFLRQEVRA